MVHTSCTHHASYVAHDAHTTTTTTAAAARHAVDHTFTEAWIAWKTLNVSIATTVDIADNSKLTMVATVVNDSGNSSSSKGVGDSSDFALLLIPSFENGRAGSVSMTDDGKAIIGVGAGLRGMAVRAIQGSTFRLPATPANRSVQLPSVYVGVELSASEPAVMVSADSTRAQQSQPQPQPQPLPLPSAAAVTAKTAQYRAREAATLQKTYGAEWADVKDAVQTALMWSLMYVNQYSLFSQRICSRTLIRYSETIPHNLGLEHPISVLSGWQPATSIYADGLLF